MKALCLITLMLFLGLPDKTSEEYTPNLNLYIAINQGDIDNCITLMNQHEFSKEEINNFLIEISSWLVFKTPVNIPDEEFIYRLTLWIVTNTRYDEEILLHACTNCIARRNSGAFKAILDSNKLSPETLNNHRDYDGKLLIGHVFLSDCEDYAQLLIQHGVSFPKEEAGKSIYQNHLQRLPKSKQIKWKKILSL